MAKKTTAYLLETGAIEGWVTSETTATEVELTTSTAAFLSEFGRIEAGDWLLIDGSVDLADHVRYAPSVIVD